MNGQIRALQEAVFECFFIKKTGNEFQDFFSEIMEKRYPKDFIRVRPWGNIGDRKNDGYLRSNKTLFQVFAPNEMSAAECVSKIDEDFREALKFWDQHIDRWVFVHNSRKEKGLGPDVVKKLLDLSTSNPGRIIENWSYEELRKLVFELQPLETSRLLHLPLTDEECFDWSFISQKYIDAVIARGADFFDRKLIRDPSGNESTIDRLPMVASCENLKTDSLVRSFSDVVESERLILLFGGYGTGKSFLLRSLFLRYCKEASNGTRSSIPIYLDLSAFQYPEISTMICAEITRTLKISPNQAYTSLLSGSNIILFVDGLEEVQETDQSIICKTLLKISHEYPNTKVVVAARPSWYGKSALSRTFSQFELRSLTLEQQERIFGQYCNKTEFWRLPSKVRELCGTPLHLEMIIDEAQSGAATLSDSPAKLLNRFLESRYRQLGNMTEYSSIPTAAFRAAACSIASNCISAATRNIEYALALTSVEALPIMKQLSSKNVLRGLQLVGIITLIDDHGFISFNHMAFRDYLGAVSLSQLIHAGKPIDSLLSSSPEWFESIMFAANSLDDFDLQTILLNAAWQYNTYYFFSALKNRSSTFSRYEMDKSLAEKLLVRLSKSYSSLVSHLSNHARRAFDPFKFEGIQDKPITVFADVDPKFSNLYYRYRQEDTSGSVVNIKEIGSARLVGDGIKDEVSGFAVSNGVFCQRHVNFTLAKKDMFSIYEFARDDFSGELVAAIKDHDVFFFTADLAYEYLFAKKKTWPSEWQNKSIASLVELEHIFAQLLKKNIKVVQYGNGPAHHIGKLKYAASLARAKYADLKQSLIPGKDSSRGCMIWDLYSTERVLEIVRKSALLILDNYKELVDTHFPGYAKSLPLRVAMPVKLCGRIFKYKAPGEWHDRSFGWMTWILPVSGKDNGVEVNFCDEKPRVDRDVFDSDKILIESKRDHRVAHKALDWLCECEVEIGHEESLLRDTVFSLLHQDFARLLQTNNIPTHRQNALF